MPGSPGPCGVSWAPGPVLSLALIGWPARGLRGASGDSSSRERTTPRSPGGRHRRPAAGRAGGAERWAHPSPGSGPGRVARLAWARERARQPGEHHSEARQWDSTGEAPQSIPVTHNPFDGGVAGKAMEWGSSLSAYFKGNSARDRSRRESAEGEAVFKGNPFLVPYGHGSKANGMQHCVALCELSNDLGTSKALQIGAAREKKSDGSSLNAEYDLANNRMGASCAGADDCYECCEERVITMPVRGGTALDAPSRPGNPWSGPPSRENAPVGPPAQPGGPAGPTVGPPYGVPSRGDPCEIGPNYDFFKCYHLDPWNGQGCSVVTGRE